MDDQYGMEMGDEEMGDPMDMDMDYYEEGGPIHEGYGDEEEEHEYGPEQEEEDEEIDFSADPQFQGLPPLDKMRKVRREILKTINDIREKFGNLSVYPDHQAHKAACEYAEYLLE